MKILAGSTVGGIVAEILELNQVFTPGGQPTATYVSREKLQLEQKVRSALIRGFP